MSWRRRHGREQYSDRCVMWLVNSSTAFPVAVLVLALLTFLTTPPTPVIVGCLAVALLPWALVAGGVQVPAMVVVVTTFIPTAWLDIREQDHAALFLGVVACAWAAAVGSRWATWVSVVGFSALAMLSDTDVDPSYRSGWIIWATGMVFGWFVGALIRREKSLADELATARLELDRAAAEQDRKAIAREVHDIVGHSLTVVLLNITGARRHLASNPAAAAEALAQAEAVGRESIETVRSVVALLASDGDSQREAPLPVGADVIPLVEQARRAGLPLALDLTGDPADLEPAVALTLVRLVQEALSNATRHAPGTAVSMQLHVRSEDVTVRIANALTPPRRDGTTVASGTIASAPAGTVATPRTGTGLIGMADRVHAVQGTLDVGARDGNWIVAAVLPRARRREAGSPTAEAPIEVASLQDAP